MISKKCKRKLTVISGICLLISTCLFSTLPLIFNKEIDNLNVRVNNTYFNTNFTWNEMLRARREYLHAAEVSSQLDIFELLNAEEKIIHKNRKSILYHVRAATEALMTVNKGDTLLQEEKEFVQSLFFPELYQLYKSNMDSAKIAYNNLNKNAKILKSKVIEIENKRDKYWFLAIALQFVGLFIGIYISGFSEK